MTRQNNKNKSNNKVSAHTRNSCGVPFYGGVSLTSAQEDMLQEIQHRDEYEIDHQLDEIGGALQGLMQIAQRQGEEVQLQSQMLDKAQQKDVKNRSKLSKVLSRFRS